MLKAKEKGNGLTPVSYWKTLRTGLRIYKKAAPLILTLSTLAGIGNAVLIGAGTLLQHRMFDSIEGTAKGSATVLAALLALLAYGGFRVLGEVVHGLQNLFINWQMSKYSAEASRLIHEKMGKIDPICLEDTKLQDQINKASQGAETVGYVVNTASWVLLFYVPYMLFMAFYLNTLNGKMIFALLCVFVPTMISQLLKTTVTSKFEEEAAPFRRRYDFYADTVTGKEFFKESRLLGAYKKLLNRFLDTCRLLSAAEWKAAKKENAIELASAAITVLGYGGIMYLLVTSLISGEISVGAFAAVFGSIGMIFDMMGGFVGTVGQMSKELGSAKNYIRFMDLPERGGVPQPADDTRGISLKNVSFTYPNATEPSIKNVSLEIAPGETVAIVGLNGAGKTTLVRLLIGFFKPSSGVVTVRGLDTRQADAASIFNGMTGVFQKYQRYKMTLTENVRISETAGQNAENTALANAGIEVDEATFPERLDTMLSREFDGVDLSGGQWQRLAIARGLYRTHQLVVLDEPTAAIDPIEETRIYKQFMDISRNKTAIIVTHRLGSAKTADRVIVMQNGSIIAAAPHETLLRDCEPYAEMYASQAMWYE
jgi:ATP-binding cassette subfamily B protein